MNSDNYNDVPSEEIERLEPKDDARPKIFTCIFRKMMRNTKITSPTR